MIRTQGPRQRKAATGFPNGSCKKAEVRRYDLRRPMTMASTTIAAATTIQYWRCTPKTLNPSTSISKVAFPGRALEAEHANRKINYFVIFLGWLTLVATAFKLARL
jgi:hypothetical protein